MLATGDHFHVQQSEMAAPAVDVLNNSTRSNGDTSLPRETRELLERSIKHAAIMTIRSKSGPQASQLSGKSRATSPHENNQTGFPNFNYVQEKYLKGNYVMPL